MPNVSPPSVRVAAHAIAGAMTCNVRVRVEKTPISEYIRDLEHRLSATEHLPRTREAWDQGVY